jgi:hypothetical protein
MEHVPGTGRGIVGTCLCPGGDCRTLPRSGYTEQPRVLTLGQVASRGALKAASEVGRDDEITRKQPKDAPRPPLLRQSLDCVLRIAPRRARLEVLSGRTRPTHNPGLKPWAMMCSRFAAKARRSPGQRIPDPSISRHYVPGYHHVVPSGQKSASHLSSIVRLSRTTEQARQRSTIASIPTGLIFPSRRLGCKSRRCPPKNRSSVV